MAKQDQTAVFKQFMKELDHRKYQPVYTLCGDEPYFNDRICDKLEREVISEAERSFNQVVYYGKDIDTQTVVSAAKRYPMMAERQLVVIKEAQNLKNLEVLNPYLEQPLSSTVLVLLFRGNGQLKKTNTFKLLSKYAVFESEKIPDYKLTDWIASYLAEHGFKTDQGGLELIAESSGNDLNTIENELKKIFLNLGERKTISEKDIEKYIGINKEFSVFELQRAIATGNKDRVAQIIDFFASDTKNNPVIVVLSTLSAFFTKLHLVSANMGKQDGELASMVGVSPFFLKEYRQGARLFGPVRIEHMLRTLNQLDLKSKGVNSNLSDEDIYKELFINLTMAR